MAEKTLFNSKMGGYDKRQVNEWVKEQEEKLQAEALKLSECEKQIAELNARLEKLTAPAEAGRGDMTVEEKVELYNKLMKKMDGDYANLLTPAIAKAKAIEKKADEEYAIRMDQARYAAEGVYDAAADRLVETVDAAVNANMDKVIGIIGDFLYKKTLRGRIETLLDRCKFATNKVATAAIEAQKLPAKAAEILKAKYDVAKGIYQDKVNLVKNKVSDVVGKVNETKDKVMEVKDKVVNKVAAVKAIAVSKD